MDAALLAPVANATPGRGAVRTPEEAARVAEQFEATYLSTVLSSMFKDIRPEAPFHGGAGEDAFGSFLSDAMAKVMSKRGGVGLASSLQSELLKLQEVGA